MSTAPATLPPTPASPGLSEIERVVDVFVAPSKTFTDILRSTSWWLPFVLMVISSVASAFVVSQQVGFDRAYQNQLQTVPAQEDRLNQLPDDQKARAYKAGAIGIEVRSYAAPVFILIFLAIYSLILWASFNFGLGAQTTFPQVFAVSIYSGLPFLFTSILTILTLYFGGNAEAYSIDNPVGTNLAYFMPDSALWLKAILGSLDIVRLWSVVLQIIGMAIIAKKTIAQSAAIVGILWLVGFLIGTGVAAAFS